MSFNSRRAAGLLTLLLCTALLSAQSNRGGVGGNVTDASGAVVPNAAVTITNLGTGEVRHVKTGGKGDFIQENLDPTTYKIEVQASGFKKGIIEKVKVDTSTLATADITLQPGDVATQVTVNAAPPLVNAESGTLSTTITQRMLTDTPLANRSVLDLAVTVPNLSGDVGTEDPQVTSQSPAPGFNLSVNGGRAGSTNFLADGVSNTGVGLAREAVAFSPETVSEFSVQTNAYSAEYGKSGGGIISVTTKSGTNDFQGMALWYLRNPAFNAAPYTEAATNRPQSFLRWNQFDGQLGGPVVIPKLYNGRNKTFFFFAGEPRYQSDKLFASANLPTAAMRNGDFSNVVVANGSGTQGGGGWVPQSVYQQFRATNPAAFNASALTTIYNHYTPVGNQLLRGTLATGATYPTFPNNVVPASMLDPVALKLINQYLPPAGAYFIDGNGFIDNYSTYRYVSDDQTRYNIKIDEIPSDKDHVFFRMTKIPETGIKGFDPNYPANGDGAVFSDSQQYMADYTRTITPTLFNDLRLSYTRGNFSNANSPKYDIFTGENLSTELGLPSFTKGGLPMFTFGLNSFGGIGSQGSTSNINVEQQYEIADTVFLSRGSMSWKFGVDLNRAMLKTLSYYAVSGGNYAFTAAQTNSNGGTGGTGGLALASFLLGVPNSVALYNSVIPYYYTWDSGAAFVQNDWKIRPNLTLNLGLRYSLQLPRTEKYNHQGVLDPSQAITVNLPSPFVNPYLGTTTTSAREVPFAFSGYGGRSRYLTPIKYLNFEPRFGFAWQPKILGQQSLVVRGGYGISHAPLTGNNRLPIPNFAAGAPTFNETTGQTNPTYVTRLSSNPPYNPFIPVNDLLGLTNNPSGLLYGGAVNFPAYVLSGSNSVPYVQNWNLSVQRQIGSNSVLEVAYVGNRGVHLYMPAVNLNNPPVNASLAYQAAGINATTLTVNDPLGRLNTAGRIYTPTYASLASPYFGYGAVSSLLDASANSIRNAGYVNFRHQANPGLTFIGNYTFGKSLDNASDASPDKGALSTSGVGGGQYSFGGTAAGDRSVSTFDVKHQFNGTFAYDLPYGKDRRWGSQAWYPLKFLFGNWAVSGIERLYSGYPAVVNIADGNFIGATTHVLRPDIVSGVPLVNPLYDSGCRTSATCQPYINPAAFIRPAAGALGDAPRTLDAVRGPWQNTLDISVQKSWNIGEKRRIQFRADFINALNHPTFRTQINNGGGTDVFGSAPNFTVTQANVTSYYNAWVTANGRNPSQNATAIYNMVHAYENSAGVLPTNFYSVQLPQGFAQANANSYDIGTLDGFKLYNLRNAYATGFGNLSYNSVNVPSRYIQLGLKFYF